MTSVCAMCGGEFQARRARTRCCSKSCARRADWAKRSDDARTAHAEMMGEAARAAHHARGDAVGTWYRKVAGRHEHRTVAEQKLGRPLRSGEVVHHIDGNKRNNDPENLIVFASQAEHAYHHAQERHHGNRSSA